MRHGPWGEPRSRIPGAGQDHSGPGEARDDSRLCRGEGRSHSRCAGGRQDRGHTRPVRDHIRHRVGDPQAHGHIRPARGRNRRHGEERGDRSRQGHGRIRRREAAQGHGRIPALCRDRRDRAPGRGRSPQGHETVRGRRGAALGHTRRCVGPRGLDLRRGVDRRGGRMDVRVRDRFPSDGERTMGARWGLVRDRALLPRARGAAALARWAACGLRRRRCSRVRKRLRRRGAPRAQERPLQAPRRRQACCGARRCAGRVLPRLSGGAPRPPRRRLLAAPGSCLS